MSSESVSEQAPPTNIAPPSSQTTPTPPLNMDCSMQQLPHISHGMPPFFANPFMSPFMPQGTPDPNMQGAAPGANSANPMGFYFSPTQYQEMMQQYFQQMMVASNFQTNMNMPFPMPGVQMNMGAFTRPESQVSQTESTAGFSRGEDDKLSTTLSHVQVTESTTASSEKSTSISVSETGSTICDPHSDTQDDSLATSAHVPSEETGSRFFGDIQLQSQSATLNNEMSPSESVKSDSGNDESEDTSCKISPVESSTEKENRTTSLIKKQMSEIEKEITRRSQNKNIKQAALPYTPETASSATVPKQTLNQLRSSFNLPENGPVLPHSTQGSQHQSGQIFPQSSHHVVTPSPFGAMPMMGDCSVGVSQMSTLPAPVQQPIIASQPFNPMSQQGFPFPMAGAPFAFQNPFPQPTYPTQNGQAHFTNEQLAAAALAQAAAAQHLGMFPHIDSAPNGIPLHAVLSTPASNGTNGLVPPPPQASNPVQKRASLPSCSDDWPSETHPQSDDPVWVMRDSYLKRQQRDQEAHQSTSSDWPEGEAPSTNGEKENVNEEDDETDRLLLDGEAIRNGEMPKKCGQKTNKETMVHEPAVLIEGVLFRARYLGSTQMMCESRGSKAARMSQAQEAVARVKAPEGEVQPSTDIDLFISTEKIMVLNTDLQRISDTDVRQDILMDHALRTISYIADIGDLVVLMARRMSASNSDEGVNSVEGVRKSPKIICHVFESEEASFIAQSIGQAFQVAYVEFLRANGIDDPSYLRQIDYQEVLNSQELLGDELEMFARKETQKDVVVPKKAGEAMGVVVVESGWGSMLPTVVLAHMAPTGPAARSNQLNIGDQIIAVNGISLVGLPLSAAQKNIQNVKTATAVRLTIVSTPPVVEVRIRRPDTKYQLGFSVQNGVICSLLRGGIAERGGIRVGHRIIEINHHSVVAVAHDRIVNMLASAVGEIHMKTMPTSMFRLLTGQETPNYI